MKQSSVNDIIAQRSVSSFMLAIIFWTVVIAALAGWHHYQSYLAAVANATTAARHSYNKDIAFRRWAASHGGVYVPVTAENPPNPYLAHIPERDIRTDSGRLLTLINPAYMTRLLHDRGDSTLGTRGHITSLQPLRPENAPDEWETGALKNFEKGVAEQSSLEQDGSETYLRLMQPMKVEQACLKCHGPQGYKVGDVRGGISVSIPWEPYRHELLSSLPWFGLGYGGLWLFGLAGILAGRHKLRLQLSDLQKVDQDLRQSEARYHGMFVNNCAVMLLIDPADGHIVDANPAACAFYGYGQDELRAMKITDINTLSMDQLLEKLAQCRVGAQHFHFKHRLANGEVRDVEVFSGPGEISGQTLFFSIVFDATERRVAKEGLRQAKFCIDHASIGIFSLGEDARILEVNDQACRSLGYSRKELLTLSILDIDPNFSLESWLQHRKVIRDKGSGTIETLCRRKDGSVFTAEVTINYFEHGGRTFSYSFFRDITERKNTEAELRKLSFAVQQSPASVTITGLEGNIEYVNPKFSQLTGYTLDEVRGLNLRLLQWGKNAEEYGNLWDTLNAGEEWHGEFHNKKKDGTYFWEQASISPIRDASGIITHYVSINEDITERKLNEEKLEFQATHDALTGLANRTLLQDRLEQSLHYAHRSGRLVAVLLLDLDRFKVINDSLGHDFGDQLLCAVADRLRQNVREADTVARLGGDEFVVLLAEVAEAENVGLVARKILDHLSLPYQIGEREIAVTASLGVSLYPKDSDDCATLIRNADMAMYRAKRNDNSNFAFYSPEMNQRILETLELESALRQALALGEFCLHYQPKVDLASGRVIGCEALVRWRHPLRGMVSPADFIPLAEETGLIVPLGTWVLKEACQQARAWQDEGLPELSVAVNLSARQFRKGDLPQLVEEILHNAGLDPRLLELELTESMVMDDPAEAKRTMQTLKELGVGLSLDDFGTGYSSLNYLRRFPVDSLKIDRSFICDVATDPSGASVVTSVIDIAHNLGLTAVAEGVETREQLDFLAGCGCDIYQGYLFSKPLPAEEFTDLLREIVG